MADEQFTRCPGCKTIFRVTAAQLALRSGQVRCGQCRTVFDGAAERVTMAPPEAPAEPASDDALAQGQVPGTLRQARPADAPATPAPPPPGVSARTSDNEVEYENRFARGRKPISRGWQIAIIVAIPMLAVVLVLQALVHFRDSLAAHLPGTRPILIGLCAVVGCKVGPLRDVAALAIEASDLQADPAHRGLLILTATIRNRARYAIDYPHLQLTLTDARDQVVVRRALAPADYLSGTADPAAGIPGNGEVAVRLFIDASATTQAGYRLYLFFP